MRTQTMVWCVAYGLAAGCGNGRDGNDGSGGLDGGIDPSGDSGGQGPGADDGGTGEADEICDDGLDNNDNGEVDETCNCEAGATQTCYAGPPEAALACRNTTQSCGPGAGDGPGLWGPCGGLCDGSTLTLDDPAMFVAYGAADGDGFTLVGGTRMGDINDDGELDLAGASMAGDGIQPDVGVGYGIFGGGCLQRNTLDLATANLSGGAPPEMLGGLRLDDVQASGVANAVIADINGDGVGDMVGTNTGTTQIVMFGAGGLPGLYGLGDVDGASGTQLTGGGGTAGTAGGLGAADYDGDGYDDLFMPASNNQNPPQCPCGPNGVNAWFGRDAFAPDTPRDAMSNIGIPHVGQASLHNFSIMGGAGDFNADGFMDITSGNGAANDTFIIAYQGYVFFGNPDRTVPASMTGLTGADGVMFTGGSNRGNHPNAQHGDFNGDGIDDLVLLGYGGTDVYIIYGRTTPFTASIAMAETWSAAEGVALMSTELFRNSYQMGVGDLDADGYDDIAIPSVDIERGGVVIVWGRPGVGGRLDVDTDPTVTVITGADGLGRTNQIAIGDADGDGLGDLVIGASTAITPNGQSGAGLIKFGSCLFGEHNPDLQLGNDGDNAMTGSGAAEEFASGRGDDTVDSGGGADVVVTGQGDDVVTISDDAFVRLDGGLGTDTLVLASDGLAVDLRTMGRARIQQFERFDLTAAGAQSLAFNGGDLSAMSTSSRTFTVVGDAADRVTLVGAWQAQGSTYVLGALAVEVTGGVSVTVQ